MKRAHLGDGNMEGCGNLTYKKTLCLQTKNSKHQMPSGPFSCGGTHIAAFKNQLKSGVVDKGGW